MGEGARPAISLLLTKSLPTIPGTPAQEADAAIEALGRLAAVDPDTIIPHIAKLLEVPSHTVAAATALEKIGDPASIAVPIIRIRLETDIKERRDAEVASLISALTRLGDATDDVVYFSSLLERRVYPVLAAKALGRIGGTSETRVAADDPCLCRSEDGQDGSLCVHRCVNRGRSGF